MPVRIIFRGLMLFQIPETGSNAGRLVAYLINNAKFAGGSKAHDHDTEVQILTGAEEGEARAPKVLKRNATLDIMVRGQKGVSARQSFTDHVPNLAEIIDKATPAIRNAARVAPNRGLIQNVVTVDGGIVRVRDVTVWDQGGYPLSGNPVEVGQRATAPAVVNFMGSTVQGHIATEVVVEIDADGVDLACDHDNRFKGPKNGSGKPSDPHMPPGTVEILISSYERPADKPTPWGFDFQWLFEAAGYGAADLAGNVFNEWVGKARAFDRELFDAERSMFLTGAQNTVGRPFPYIDSVDSLTPLQRLTPLTNYPKILVCVHGMMPSSDTALQTETAAFAGGTPRGRESNLRPAVPAPQVSLAKKKAPAKKGPVKKAAAKKTPTKKTPTKKTPTKPKKSATPKKSAKPKKRRR